MKTPLKPSTYLASFTAFLVVLGALLFIPAFAPLAAGNDEGKCREAGKGPSHCNDLVEMEVRDVIPLKEAQTHAVVLVSKDREVVLPIFVDESAAVAIAFRLAHRHAPHPLAHDLLDSVVTELGGTVTEVRIDDVKDQIYFGRVFIAQGRKHLELEARPSDSISMALTKGAKIYASHKVITEAGITRQEIERLRQKDRMMPKPGDEGPGVGGSGPGTGDEGPGTGGAGVVPMSPPAAPRLTPGNDSNREISL